MKYYTNHLKNMRYKTLNNTLIMNLTVNKPVFENLMRQDFSLLKKCKIKQFEYRIQIKDHS